FEARLGLKDRWAWWLDEQPSAHFIRPRSSQSFDLPLWQGHFEQFDAASTRQPLEVRHPFVDLRILRFMLAVPAMPWCRQKYLERRALRGMLPAEVLWRSKSTPAKDPIRERLERLGLPMFKPDSRMNSFVIAQYVPS